MSTLLQISEDILALGSLFEEQDDGELSPEREAILDAFFKEAMTNRDDKMDNYGALIRQFQLRAAVRKEEMERLAIRVRVDENAAKRLKDRLKEFMEIHELKKIETNRYQLRVQANGGKQAVEVACSPDSLPVIYQRIKIEADNDALRDAISSGAKVNGVTLLPRGSHLRIS